MASTDPFMVVKEQVTQTLNTMQSLYGKWKEQFLNNDAAVDTTLKDLNAQFEYLDDDLSSLDYSNMIVEKNRQKYYHIDEAEFARRKEFVATSREKLSQTRTEIQRAQKGRGNRESQERLIGRPDQPEKKLSRKVRMEKAIEEDHDEFIKNETGKQLTIIKKQDQDIDELYDTVKTVKHVGVAIGDEIDDQNKILEEMKTEVDSTSNSIKAVTQRIEKLLDDHSAISYGVILVLVLVLVGLLILVIKI